ncbi:hypothetical protein Y1Q_0012493 [Alligator mississippiensis]|uniref:Uncharacterized protein n=1 Tax=Alligator mississippiensis TaxID=8496 RepID=A0A151M7T6_ALLMI|nr:hypothetical protein Y1Q_0012493 [Alligator mississippiensis]
MLELGKTFSPGNALRSRVADSHSQDRSSSQRIGTNFSSLTGEQIPLISHCHIAITLSETSGTHLSYCCEMAVTLFMMCHWTELHSL